MWELMMQRVVVPLENDSTASSIVIVIAVAAAVLIPCLWFHDTVSE
jgi:hypothetical protein